MSGQVEPPSPFGKRLRAMSIIIGLSEGFSSLKIMSLLWAFTWELNAAIAMPSATSESDFIFCFLDFFGGGVLWALVFDDGFTADDVSKIQRWLIFRAGKCEFFGIESAI